PAAPVMLPAHLDAWVQTAPSPAADPDVALWLHGPRGGPAEVQIIWRADISATHLREDSPLDAVVVDSLNASPPSAAEALAVPFTAARAWLRGAVPTDIADVDADLAE